jgi:tripartite-type tricarboxylate transporter receptor subunit TctC
MKVDLRGFHLLLSLAAICLNSAFAQNNYPTRPIQMIIPYAAASSTDIVFRILAPKLSELLSTQVIIVNKPGGAATIGMNQVAKAPPDGYTLGVATLSFAANPHFMAGQMPFDSEKDLVPVSLVTRTPLVLTVNATVPARSVKELIALARAKPNSLNYGSAGIASSGHLAGAMFASMAGIKMTHIAYSGATGSSPGLAAGQTQMQIAAIPSSLPGIKSGRAIALAVTTAKPVPTLPGVPTIAEAGVPNFEMYEWAGVLAPAGTQHVVIEKLYQGIVKALADPAIKERIEGLSVQLAGSTPDELDRHIKKELATWSKIAAEINAAEKSAQ